MPLNLSGPGNLIIINMLSSANKSGPTIKPFIQPYFIEIAPDGAVISFCSRFNALLHKKGVYDVYPGKNIAQVFLQLGGLPDMIRWTPTLLPGLPGQPANWQLTGVKTSTSLSPVEITDPPGYPLVNDILESITDGFFMLDKDFCVTLWNREVERITRLSKEEMVGRNLWQKMPEWIGTETWQSFHRALDEKVTVTFEQYSERSGQWLEKSIYPYPSGEGAFVYFKDVTTRKKQDLLLALEKRVLELNSDPHASLSAIVDCFLEGLEKIFPGMHCSVLTLNEDQITVRHLSAPGLPPEFSSFIDGRSIGPQAGSCGTAMFRKERVIVSDITTDPLWTHARDLALRVGLRACWSLPVLTAKGEVLAAFATYYKIPKFPTEKELEIVERAADLLKIILENKRAEEEVRISHERYKQASEALLKQELDKQKQVAQAIVDAQERERAEIGKELHDNINQILSTTKLYLELARNNEEERLNLIERSAANIHETIHEIRNISRSLVPSSIGDLGLLDSVHDLVESIKATGVINVEFYAEGPFDEMIGDKEKLMLFRIIQEQVNNVMRHSGAGNLIIELVLEEPGKIIKLNITDDGKGFNPDSQKNKKGLGLSNIMSRAGLFGGKVTIHSSPGKGCKLQVQVPI